MESFIKCLILLNVLINVLASDAVLKNSTAKIIRIRRTGSYPFLPVRDYGAIGSDKDDSSDDSVPSSHKSKLQSGGDYPIFNEYKGNEQSNQYGFPSFPSFADNKGSPFPAPSWLNPDQMLQMMAAIKNTEDISKPEETGLFSKLITDPKIAAAAFIPLSIVAAAVVPVLMNYMMGNTATPTVSTTANNRESRSLDVSKNLEELVISMLRFSRAMENDECLQMTICKVVSDDASATKSEYARKVASAIVHLFKDDRLDDVEIKQIVDAARRGKCADVCKNSTIIPKNDKKNINMLL
ncbi:uncharacterized protein TNCT_238181 [Trichonephila clavata]|uniref:Uncharacterized protein n=1 Tax=Trichonephila clavata TaxID=2740835 RepID=A0A8X6I552_TRICU|nr:uncharacterized protein TNCT_238181 [Trichonephila clavata]